MDEGKQGDGTTILDLFQKNVAVMPRHRLLTKVDRNCEEIQAFTYQELDDDSNAVAAMLLQKGCTAGDHVMVAYPIGLDFLVGMVGCMKIGVVPCSIYPPNPKKMRSEVSKFKRFANDAGAKYALSTSPFAQIMSTAGTLYGGSGTTWLGTEKLNHKKNKLSDNDRIVPDPNSVAFIQYTSGSTGHPKGVMISHAALLKNCVEIAAIGGAQPSNTGVIWVPQYHDMGLVGGFMTSLFSGVHLVAASPLDFMVNPLLWADMVEKYDADFTCGPNFAFALLLKRLRKAGRTSDWSGVQRAILGGEPTRVDVVSQLIDDLNMKAENVWNMYGMAECGLLVTAGVAQASADGVVACGPSDSEYVTIRISSNGKNTLADGEVGPIFVASLLAASGYHGKEDLTKATFGNHLDGVVGRASAWLDTGDLGKVESGQLFVTGRSKDVIIINGKNFYPADIEKMVDEALDETIRPGRTAAVQLDDTNIAITVELRQSDSKASNEIFGNIKDIVNNEFAVSVGQVLVLKQGVTAKTTSGKLKRKEIQQFCLTETWKRGSVVASYGVIRKSLAASAVEARGTVILPEVKHRSLQETLRHVLGPNVNMGASWENNGMSSLKHAEIISNVEEFHMSTLQCNFHETFQTPAELLSFLESLESNGLPVKLENCSNSRQPSDKSESLSLPLLWLCQTIGVAFIFLLFSASLITSYFIGKLTSSLSARFVVGSDQRLVAWSWLPVVIPSFGFTFSLAVLMLKWLVVGRHRSTIVDFPSLSFLRWWFVDRLMEMWEFFVGCFIVDTKLIWLMYRLMGANLDVSSRVNAFIREFDLVTVGKQSTIEHQIRCRKFRSSSKGDDTISIAFRPVVIGKACEVNGMAGPGVKLGDSSKIESRTAVAEGAEVPLGVVVKGSPAYNAGLYKRQTKDSGSFLLVELSKIFLLVVELYHFFGLFLLAQMLLNQHLRPDWRYTPLVYWIVIVPLTSALGLLSSIVLKWAMIGRRSPGQNSTNPLRVIVFWFCDFHFRLVYMVLFPVLGMSRFWNIVLFLHGLDIDMTSLPASVLSFPPSMVDLVHIRRSFISKVELNMNDRVEIVDSNIGFEADIRKGAKIHRSMVPPGNVVEDDIFDASFRATGLYQSLGCSMIFDQFFSEVAQLCLCTFPMAFCFVPPYELFMAFVTPHGSAIPWLSLVLLVQCLTWFALERIVQTVVQLSPDRIRDIVYPASLVLAWNNRVWNILALLARGTPFTATIFRFMGAEVKGHLLYFGHDIYDFQMLHFEDNCIVDDAHISGHYVVFGKVTMKDTFVGGIVHPGTYCPAGGSTAHMTESGPWKVYLSCGERTTEDF